MKLYPAIIAHGLADVQTAVAVGRPCTLLSAPGAALYAGCRWWAELLQQGDFEGQALLDCGAAPGRALEALKLGLNGVVLTCEAAPLAVVAGIAAEMGALLLPAAPPALDLGQPGAARKLAAWLDDKA
jgi:hypothetical protein